MGTIVIFGAALLVVTMPDAFGFLGDVALGYDVGGDRARFLSLSWLASCAITAAVIFYRDPSLLRRSSRSSTAAASAGRDDETLKPNVDTTPSPIYAAPIPPPSGSDAGGNSG